ncbi:TPA: DUF563 domain-containing protein [Klebsiella quasipneumoniae subsp. similipneumoniae]
MKEKKSPLQTNVIQNGIVLPCKKNYKKNGWGEGGVVDSGFSFIEVSGLYSKWSSFGGAYDFSKNKMEKIDDDVIWFGFFYKHWGHFLLDFISRMWILLDDYRGQKIVYVSHGDVIDGNYMEFFNLLGIENDKLIRIDKVTQCKSVIVPEYAKKENEYHSYYLRLMNTVSKAAVNTSSEPLTPGLKVYFSRMAFKDAAKKEFGEEYIENLMLSAGYSVMYPEKMTLKQQVSIWNSADEIICINGTIPLNLIFAMSHMQNVFILNKAKIHHQNLIDIIDIRALKNIKFIDCFYEKFSSKAQNLGRGPFFLRVSDELVSNMGVSNYNQNNFYYKINAHLFLYKFIIVNKTITAIKSFVKKIINLHRT